MTKRKWFLLSLLIVPWLTIPLLGRKSFKRYFFASISICLFTKVLDIFGEKKKWWRFYKGIPPFDSMNFFNFGPYFIASLWILKMTYGKFRTYLVSNVILHISFIYLGGLKLVKRYKIFTLEGLTKFQYLIVDFFRALLLYGFQYIKELRLKNSSYIK